MPDASCSSTEMPKPPSSPIAGSAIFAARTKRRRPFALCFSDLRACARPVVRAHSHFLAAAGSCLRLCVCRALRHKERLLEHRPVVRRVAAARTSYFFHDPRRTARLAVRQECWLDQSVIFVAVVRTSYFFRVHRRTVRPVARLECFADQSATFLAVAGTSYSYHRAVD